MEVVIVERSEIPRTRRKRPLGEFMQKIVDMVPRLEVGRAVQINCGTERVKRCHISCLRTYQQKYGTNFGWTERGTTIFVWQVQKAV